MKQKLIKFYNYSITRVQPYWPGWQRTESATIDVETEFWFFFKKTTTHNIVKNSPFWKYVDSGEHISNELEEQINYWRNNESN